MGMIQGSGRGVVLLFNIVLTFSALLHLVAAIPGQPDFINVTNSTRHVESTTGYTIPAQAGNVSSLVMTDKSSSQFWQGYFGNVTGTIVLDDGSNNTLFSWELANPTGEVYATNASGSVNWGNMTCVNLTGNASDEGVRMNLTTLAVQFNMNVTNSLENLSLEAFNYTFNNTFIGTVQIGTSVITSANLCPLAYTFINNAYQTASFKEVLLHDNQSALVFTAILENSKNGYQAGNNDKSDFQMVVPVDGSPGKSGLSSYYFYVELQ